MIHDIVNARAHLIFRQRHGIARIEDREFRHDIVPEHMADLEMLLVIRDDRAAVHLGAGAGHCQHAADRHDLAVRLLKACIVFLPRILVAVNGDRDRLGIIADRAAADREDKIGLMCFCGLDALTELFSGRVRHDAGDLRDILAAFLQDRGDLIVDAVFPDRAAAVDQQDIFAVLRQLILQKADRILTEIELCGIVVAEISEHNDTSVWLQIQMNILTRCQYN